MRIGIEGTVAIKRLGGISEYARQLIIHLAKIDSHNDYTVLTTALNRKETYALPVLGGRFHERKVPMPARLVERLWQKSGYPSFEMLAGRSDVALFPRPVMCRSAAPRVAAIHDLSWLLFPELAQDVDRGKHLHDLQNVADHATAILAISEATKRDIVEHLHVDEKRVHVTHLGFDESITHEPPADHLTQFRAKFGVGDSPYYLHVGTLEPRKNLVRLIHAFSKFKKHSKLSHKLVLAGREGWLFEAILAAKQESAFAEDVVITGPISTSERIASYWGAETVVFPSLYEGFGLPILEAQAAGRPVLTGTGGSLAEVGMDSVVAVDVTDESALAHGMHALATDAILRKKLIVAGSENVKRFSWDKTARDTLKVLEQVARM